MIYASSILNSVSTRRTPPSFGDAQAVALTVPAALLRTDRQCILDYLSRT